MHSCLVRAHNEARTGLALFPGVSCRLPTIGNTVTRRNFFKQTVRLSSERAADLGLEIISETSRQTLPRRIPLGARLFLAAKWRPLT